MIQHQSDHVDGNSDLGHSDLPHAGLDVSEPLLDRPDAAELLRRASMR